MIDMNKKEIANLANKVWELETQVRENNITESEAMGRMDALVSSLSLEDILAMSVYMEEHFS